PPSIPWGGVNAANLDYPDYLRAFHDKKFAETKFDFSFLPRIRSGKGSDVLGEKSYQATEEELLGFIAGLSTKNMRWKVVGEFPSYASAAGKASVLEGSFKLPLLVFSDPPVFDPNDLKALKKPVVWLQGQIHGGESSGGDAMQVLAKRLADGDLNYLLKKISVVIVPRYNVDGAWRNQRGTNSYRYRVGIDQNRDNQGFESAITRTMHRLVNEYEPFFFGDAHEMGFTTGSGYVNDQSTGLTIDWSGYDVATLIAPIYNHAEALKKYVSEVFEPAYHKNIIARGLRWAWYTQTSTTPPGETPGKVVGLRGTVSADVRQKSGDSIIMVSAADGGSKKVPLQTFDGAIDTGITDPSFGLKGACSILTESTTPAIGVNLGLRIAGHVAAYEAVMKTAYDKADEFYPLVLKARQDMAARGKKVTADNLLVLTIHYPEESVEHSMPVLTAKRDAVTKAWSVEEGVLKSKMFLSRNGTPNVSVIQPGAYIIKANDATIAR
ncbi:MAG: M14 family zinc carboxypeptidase, partial [Cloacibacillus sp.]